MDEDRTWDGIPPGPESDKIETAEVFRTQDRFGFMHVCNALKTNGIPFIVQDEALAGIMGITIDGLAVKRVLVKTTDLETADRIIKELMTG